MNRETIFMLCLVAVADAVHRGFYFNKFSSSSTNDLTAFRPFGVIL